jgi:hypothetical protein
MGMELTEQEVKNINAVSEMIMKKIYTSRDTIDIDEIKSFEKNPLKYFIQFGLRESIISKIRFDKVYFQEFQNSVRNFARRIRNKVIEFFDRCFQCVVGLLILIATIFNGAGSVYPGWPDLREDLMRALEWYFGSNYLLRGIVDKITDSLKKFGMPIFSPENLAQYICYQFDICEEPGIIKGQA